MRTLARTALVAVLVLAVAVGVPTVFAGRDVAPAPATISHPSYLQTGTCDQPGDPVAALAESASSTTVGTGGTPAATPVASAGAAIPAAVSVTAIDRPLDELLGAGLVVRVVASVDDPDTDIACGAIAGQPDADGNVYLALAERGGSSVSGVVWLQRNGAEATTVTLFLIPVSPSGSPAT